MQTSRDAALWHEWSTGGEVRLRLPIGALEELHDRTGKGPYELLEALAPDPTGLPEGEEDVDPLEVARRMLERLRGASDPNRLAVTIIRTAARWGDNSPAALDALENRLQYQHDATGWLTLAASALNAALRSPEDEPIPRLKSKATGAQPVEQDGKGMSFGAFYQQAAVMGLAPSEMRNMSLWQFFFYKDGSLHARGIHPGYALSEAEEKEIDDWMDEWEKQLEAEAAQASAQPSPAGEPEVEVG